MRKKVTKEKDARLKEKIFHPILEGAATLPRFLQEGIEIGKDVSMSEVCFMTSRKVVKSNMSGHPAEDKSCLDHDELLFIDQDVMISALNAMPSMKDMEREFEREARRMKRGRAEQEKHATRLQKKHTIIAPITDKNSEERTANADDNEDDDDELHIIGDDVVDSDINDQGYYICANTDAIYEGVTSLLNSSSVVLGSASLCYSLYVEVLNHEALLLDCRSPGEQGKLPIIGAMSLWSLISVPHATAKYGQLQLLTTTNEIAKLLRFADTARRVMIIPDSSYSKGEFVVFRKNVNVEEECRAGSESVSANNRGRFRLEVDATLTYYVLLIIRLSAFVEARPETIVVCRHPDMLTNRIWKYNRYAVTPQMFDFFYPRSKQGWEMRVLHPSSRDSYVLNHVSLMTGIKLPIEVVTNTFPIFSGASQTACAMYIMSKPSTAQGLSRLLDFCHDRKVSKILLVGKSWDNPGQDADYFKESFLLPSMTAYEVIHKVGKTKTFMWTIHDIHLDIIIGNRILILDENISAPFGSSVIAGCYLKLFMSLHTLSVASYLRLRCPGISIAALEIAINDALSCESNHRSPYALNLSEELYPPLGYNFPASSFESATRGLQDSRANQRQMLFRRGKKKGLNMDLKDAMVGDDGGIGYIKLTQDDAMRSKTRTLELKPRVKHGSSTAMTRSFGTGELKASSSLAAVVRDT